MISKKRKRKQGHIISIGLLNVAVWTIILGGFLLWERHIEKRQDLEVLIFQARAFTQQITTTRHWIAAQGGVYAPITASLQPNPYLPIEGRDVVTTDGLRLTKINPSFMTRQISEMAEQNNRIKFHLTSTKPLRPENKPDPWEEKILPQFSSEAKEIYEIVQSKTGSPLFRYMVPFFVTKECLQCHAEQGYQLGDQRGGISLAIQLDPILTAQEEYFNQTTLIYFVIWLCSTIGIAYGFYRLKKGDDQRLELIDKLQEALAEVRELKGLLPICSSCKKIRDDKGYWQQIEVYISERSEAKFSHGICLDCAKELYPEIYGDLKDEKDIEEGNL